MSVRFRLVNMFDSVVSTLLATECQKYSTRWLSPMKREPKTTSARSSMIGWISRGILGRIVLEVGVLDDDDVAGGVRESRRAGPRPCPG